MRLLKVLRGRGGIACLVSKSSLFSSSCTHAYSSSSSASSTASSNLSAPAGHGLSLRRGPDEPPLFTGTIPQHFAAIVSRHGGFPAVIARRPCPNNEADAASVAAAAETRLTYHALDEASNRLASSLASLGVASGHRVAVSLGNRTEYAVLTYALYKLGAILVPLNPAFTPAQVVAALAHLDASLLVISAVIDVAYKPGRGRCARGVVDAVAPDLSGGYVRGDAVPSLRHVVLVDNRADHVRCQDEDGDAWRIDDLVATSRGALVSYDSLAAGGSPRPVVPTVALAPSDVINIQFTSGTTSMPKAAMLSHTSILNNGILCANRMGLVAQDRLVVPPPLFHCFGSVLGYMATATTGASILFPSPAFDPAATLRMCVDHDVTGLHGVTTMLNAVLDALESSNNPDRPASLRKGIVAGSSVPESLMHRVYRGLGLDDLVIGYGMTETSPVNCMTSPSDSPARRATSVGRPMPHTSVKIVSPDDRSVIQPLGVHGELASSGYLVMEGYYGDAERTAAVRVREPDEASSDGSSSRVWMYSGDEAVMDQDGYVGITGRIKDLIIRGGENIHPLDVEDCLFQMPGVHEASVLGLPDDRLGESVAAFIVVARGWTTTTDEDDSGNGNNNNNTTTTTSTTPTDENDSNRNEKVLSKDAVREWVRARLANHLVPQHIFWVADFPKTESGKIQKFKLRDRGARDIQCRR